ncbi:TetR/AcrR family transcriptional regulator [Chitinophaga agrisoli]|uniref:TetR/AcrR family transcriptional regulator n=1 Tax=Chitinophaga agrisoli TaxID=2607653 RepID=A0A5B2VWX6_9BACT|nr:TetR/AcrR family transcriptional regulator [Chitinophaga agrisoli]KAA2243831.1 TetR/AcrR family transcriptional regulator [Chitinophaga agrisoli]
MERKPVAGAIRNKERSKKKFLSAVGKILKTKGYQGLRVNDIATTAGLDKKMIYSYFGGTDQLIDEYIRSQDFWSNIKEDKIPAGIKDGGKAFSENMLLSQFDYVFKNKELQKILLWRLSEKRKSLKKLTDVQEKNGEALFRNIMDPHFGDNDKQFRAVMAILVSGIYYLNLYAAVNGSVFCGLDMKSEEGRDEVKKALSFLVERTYGGL